MQQPLRRADCQVLDKRNSSFSQKSCALCIHRICLHIIVREIKNDPYLHYSSKLNGVRALRKAECRNLWYKPTELAEQPT